MSHTQGIDVVLTKTFAVNFSGWKSGFLKSYFPDRQFEFLPIGIDTKTLRRTWLPRIQSSMPCDFFVWGAVAPQMLVDFAHKNALTVWYVEDGFIRSSRPSASRTPPLSLTLDRSCPYFDCRQASELELLLNSFDFASDSALLSRAKAGIRLLLDHGVSKYNAGPDDSAKKLYGPKRLRRVLVVGQVEADASIRFGCAEKFSNNDLVRLAAKEHPEAQVLYRPHPDVLSRVRHIGSDPKEIEHLCQIIDQKLSIAEALKTVDHVYTITSLVGFEALLRGIKVTTIGCPFYAGWGLTDDRQRNPRRQRVLSVDALFAGAYLIYARYFDPGTGKEVSFERAIATVISERATQQQFSPAWHPWGAYGVLGWRHLLTILLTPIIRITGSDRDMEDFRSNPIAFFRGLSDRKLRILGRILYPFG